MPNPKQTAPVDMGALAQAILTQLKIANRLTVARLKKELPQNEIVALLASTGATNAEIAHALDTTPATVGVTLQRIKKKNGKNSTPISDESATPKES